MALTPTQVRALWIGMSQRFKAAENRTFQDPVSALGLSNWIDKGVIDFRMEQKLRVGQDVNVKFLHKGQNTAQARQIDHTGPVSNSSLVPISFTEHTRTAKVEFTPSRSNAFSEMEIFENQLLGLFRDLTEDARQQTITELLAARTQVNVVPAGFGTFNGTSNFFEVAAADAERAFEYFKAMMGENMYNGIYDMVADSRMWALWKELSSQGEANGTNWAWQFDGLNGMMTPGTIAGLYSKEALIMQPESFAVAEWLPQQYLSRKGVNFSDNVGVFDYVSNPYVPNSVIGLHMYEAQDDTSGSGGDVEDIKMEIQATMYRATVPAPLSVTDETPIFGVAILPTLP